MFYAQRKIASMKFHNCQQADYLDSAANVHIKYHFGFKKIFPINQEYTWCPP